MVKKVLVANRGEIAVRIMRTCRRLGIGTVAVYSEPDARAVHVKAADEAVALGGATAAESYLVAQKIVDAARATGAEAVHPGYGFLSENAGFARTIAEAGLVFIGPPADAIASMGDKIESKILAAKAGVPTIPGDKTPVSDPDVARRIAETVGYPVLLKPAAGGGGKGMRIVHKADEMADALAGSLAEAKKAFGDDRVFIERYIGRPRHIEIQLLADTHGNAVSLGERECSVQRRYQKVIEEAPSVVVDEDLRARMGEAACNLARAAGYTNAGTVEYILDEDRNFYFLEMNTRLQVEHPVTENVTGLDLVEQQLRIASGEPLSLKQEDVKIRGWSIEARICAEDPERGFVPSTGPITRYEEPRGRNVRVDSGVEGGSTVTVYYDSLLAKLIARGKDREEARLALVDALNSYDIEGPSTNIDYVNTILNHPRFIDGDLSTNFIAEHMDKPESRPAPPRDRLHHMAIAAVLVYHNRHNLVVESLRPMASSVGGVHVPGESDEYMVKAGEDVFHVVLRAGDRDRLWNVSLDGADYAVVTPEFEFYRRRLRLEIGGAKRRFLLRYEGNFIGVAHCGERRTFEIYEPREWKVAGYMPEPTDADDSGGLVCPMPGLIVDIRVAPGDKVYAGQVLVTLESMKMESGVSAARDAEVSAVLVEKGQAVDAGDVLVEFAQGPKK